jgi:hypothetical protein
MLREIKRTNRHQLPNPIISRNFKPHLDRSQL